MIKNVLVVEDDPTYLHLWKRMAKDLGIKNLVGTAKPEQAAQWLNKQSFDLLISDVVLPTMNGYELAKLARKTLPKIEILLTTGYLTDLSRFDLKGLHCHLLHKPYQNLTNVSLLLQRLIQGGDPYADMDEDSFSENQDCPEITEWTL